jgi:hypothetical protein
MRERTPWPAMLQVAKSIGVEPCSFWRLSLCEWRALLTPASDALSRKAFDALAKCFPDKT